MKNVPRFTIFSVALSQLIAILGFAPVTRASSMMPPANEYAIEFHPPEDRGAPDVAVGGATRCPPQLTPLVPHDASRDYDNFSAPHFGLTVRPNPSFFVLLHPHGIQEIGFEIYEYESISEVRGKDGDLVYETWIDLSSIEFNERQNGSIGISLPPDVALEPGKTYRWYVDALVGDPVVAEVVFDSGWIERVEVSPELGSQLASAETPLDRARVYAEAGIWHDAFEILVQERRLGDTPELEAEWKEFLMSADFAEYVTEIPLLDCCRDRRSEPR